MVKKELLQILNLRSEEEYVNLFFSTLMETNQTYDYFVNWKKVYEKVQSRLNEIMLLNSLTKLNNENEQIAHLKNLLKRYPEVLPVIPLIIAVRDLDFKIFELHEQDSFIYKKFNFNKRHLSDHEIMEIIDFCQKSGILKLLSRIKDLYAYLIGLEVGIDTNARKNRSGTIFELIVGKMINQKISNHIFAKHLLIKFQDPSIKIRRNKNIDIAIYYDNKPFIATETNFYNVSGSKPIEVANAYINLQKQFEKNNIIFIWLTDGPGWLKSKRTIRQTFSEISYPMNYFIAKKAFVTLIEKLVS